MVTIVLHVSTDPVGGPQQNKQTDLPWKNSKLKSTPKQYQANLYKIHQYVELVIKFHPI